MKGQRRKLMCEQTTCEDPNTLKSRSMFHRQTKRRWSSKFEEEILPDNMMMEILLRLPVRSLLQFKCVCKSWKTLISDPQFAKDHLRYSKHVRLAFRHRGDIVSLPVFDNNISSTPDHERMHLKFPSILGSCNGLLCLHNFRKVTLWNPSTRFMSKISLPIFENQWDVERTVTNAGFGYDQLNDKYKLVVMLRFGLPTQKVIKIYTFGATNNSSATTIICNLPPPYIYSFHGKFVSGTLNWIATGVFDCHLSKYKCTIFWFDLEKETFHEMLPPKQHMSEQEQEPALSVLNNCLCVSFYDSYQTHWVLWSMKKHGVADSWTKLFTIPLLSIDDELDLFYISKSGVLFGLYRDLFLYDPINGRLESSLMMSDKYCVSSQVIYHESLISPLC